MNRLLFSNGVGIAVLLTGMGSTSVQAQDTLPIQSDTSSRLDSPLVSTKSVTPAQETGCFSTPCSTISLQQYQTEQSASIQAADLQPLAQLLVPNPSPPAAEGSPSLQFEPSSPGQKPFQPTIYKQSRGGRYSPGVTLFAPSGYGKSWGNASVGVGFQSRARFSEKADGAFGGSVGFGDARRAVGLDVGLTVLDVSEFDRAAVSLKLHRLLPEDFALAVGVSGIYLGEEGGMGESVSPYGTVTKRIVLNQDDTAPFNQLFLTLGAGGGNFRSESNVINGTGSTGVFGSVAVRVLQPVSVITEWSGQDLSVGVSIIPFKNLPLVITPIATDLTGSAGDGARFVLGIGYGFSY